MAAILSQPVGHKATKPDNMYDAGKTVWARELRERQPDVSVETIEIAARPWPRAARFRVRRLARFRQITQEADMKTHWAMSGSREKRKHLLRVSIPPFDPNVWSGRALQVVSPSWR